MELKNKDIFGVGRDLSDDTIESLSDEQKEQLERLRDSATQISTTESHDVSGTDKSETNGSENPKRH